MPDHATSSSPAVQAQLDRLGALSPGADILGLERITALLARLGDPHHALPPVLHVAGTNGKGSTCAFLRAAIEAAGLCAHVYSSPHLVRFNERIRLAGSLIGDAALAVLLSEVLDVADGIGASFFEVTTAAAFLAFARTPADACIVEVGLGGRLDATNVVALPAATGIAQLGIDHQSFLGDTIEQIAAEKAGIAKAGVPLVTMHYAPAVAARVATAAAASGARLLREQEEWRFDVDARGICLTDARGVVDAASPALAGPHQPANLALAMAMLRSQSRIAVPDAVWRVAPQAVRWPARMQRLSSGPLTALLPDGAELWLDGGHNPAAAAAIAASLATLLRSGSDRPVHLIVGMLANKDPAGLLAPLARLVAGLQGVPIAAHAHHTPADLVRTAITLGIPASPARGVAEALRGIAAATPGASPLVLILGSLYLAGEVLAANGENPT